MPNIVIPQGYRPPLTGYEMQRAIEFIKSRFQEDLCGALNLRRVSAPLFVEEASGLNDNLNGYERPVGFDVPDVGTNGQVVHSLAKWKRLALKRYGFRAGKGLYTDMNAIRRDEVVDNLHSVYVDQWDWEKVMGPEDRNEAYLKATVRAITGAVADTADALGIAFPSLRPSVCREVLRHHPGVGRPVPRPVPRRAGARLCQGAPHHFSDADRRQPEQREAPRRPRPRL